MAQTQLAVQLYTLREHTQTPGDIARTLRKLADQGWGAVQASALGPIEPRELKKILDDNGLVCCATHRSAQLFDDPAAVIEEHAILDCRYTAIGGYFPSEQEFSEANWRDWILRYNSAASAFGDSPLRLGYHNHSHELAKLGGKQDLASRRPWDLLVEMLAPEVWFEIDTYWLVHGGADPAWWIKRLAGRVPCVHLKDLALTPGREQYMAEVGVGNLCWPEVLGACREAGVEWYIVEQDTCYRDPFDSLKTSLENLKAMGLK